MTSISRESQQGKANMLSRVIGMDLDICEKDTHDALKAERTAIVDQYDEVEGDAWMERCQKWLTDVAFVNDIPEILGEPIPLGLRPGENIGPVRKRRRTVEYVPVESVACESEESESEDESSGSECDSNYEPDEEHARDTSE